MIAGLVVAACVLVVGLGCLSAPAAADLRTTYQRQLTGFGRLGADSVAVDGLNGDVLVADSGSGVIQVFNSAGTHLATWNGSNVLGIGSFGGAGVAVAANDATGDVYVVDETDRVVDVLNAEGLFLATWNGANTPAGSFTSLDAVAVDQANGDVYVAPRNPAGAVIDVFDASGKYLSQISGAGTLGGSFAPEGSGFSVAVNGATGDVLVAEESTNNSDRFEQPAIYEFGASGEYLATWYGFNTPTGQFQVFGTDVAVSEAGGDVLVASGTGSVVDVFTSDGEYLSQFTGAETPQRSFHPRGVAVDPASSEVYVSSEEGGVVDVFAAAPIPDAVAVVPTIAPPGGVTLNGMVDPNGSKVSECRFEYGSEADSYTHTVECAQTAAIGEGHSAVPVSATVSGLQPDDTYHFRLVAANAKGLSTGRDATFIQSTAPTIEEETSSRVSSEEASVSAQIDAAGLASSYRVEYGPSVGYGSSTTAVSLGDPQSASGVTVHLTGLRPETEYHFRFVATNSFGATQGGDEAFTTAAAAAVSSALPDGRAYELVSPPSTEEREVYVPVTSEQEPSQTEVITQRPMQAAGDGGAIAYVAEPSPGGSGSIGEGLGNEYLATRSSNGGWNATDITPVGSKIASGIYTGFTADLSTAALYDSATQPLAAGLSIPPNCSVIYSRSLGEGIEGAFQPLFTNILEGAGAENEEHCAHLQFAGASADGSHIFFETPVALTPDAPGPGEPDLYESAAGQLRLVNVLPDGDPTGDAKFGSPGGLLLDRVASADGSRVFWTDRKNGDLYVRENNGTLAAKTALVAEGGEYQAASADGSLAFFTKSGDLYTFDVDSEQTSDLASGGQVQGVVGVSEDGSYVYFVGKGALRGTGGEALRNDRGEEPVAGEENLYLSQGGATTFIATLAGSDVHDWSSTEVWTSGFAPEVEAPDVAYTAEVTPDGHSVVFMSARSLTPYDAHGAGEVYVYDAQAGRLWCVSCAPNGAPPTAGGGFLSHPTDNTRLPRWINEAGDEVFFETAEALVPQDSNGKVDVYEWEREGAGGCARSGGCVYLLSGGVSDDGSWFIDADAKGENVFFATRAQLVTADQNDNVDLYDARANGHPPVSPPACTGTGCQGVPPAGPIFATPASVTFNGIGNYPPAPLPRSAAQRSGGKCAGSKKRDRGRCVKQRRHTRRARRARVKQVRVHPNGKRRRS